MNEENELSTVNKSVRKERHQRLKLISPLFKSWARIEGGLSPKEKKIEHSFFWRVTSLGTLFFFVASLFPQFVTTAEEFWTLSGQAEIPVQFDQNIGLVAEGFLVKPEIIDVGPEDRTGITDIREYTVEPGDTISQIAVTHGVTTRTILQNNEIPNPNALKAGQVLKIIPVDGVLHEVKKGDTLAKIGTKYKTEQEKIIAQNDLLEDEPLVEGDHLIIPGAKKELPKPVYVARPTYSGTYTPPSGGGGSAPGRLLRPTSGKYTQYFRYGHWAVDIAAPGGTPIYAAAGGTVIKASYGWGGGYGNHLIIDHGGGLQTLYAHNSKLYVNAGQTVSQGQAIAAMGNTGRVYGRTGIHLHFEVRRNGVKQNPLAYF